MTWEDQLVKRLSLMDSGLLDFLNLLAQYPDKVWSPTEVINEGVKQNVVLSHQWLFVLKMIDYRDNSPRNVKFYVTGVGKRILRKMGFPSTTRIQEVKDLKVSQILGSHDDLARFVLNHPEMLGCLRDSKHLSIYQSVGKQLNVDVILSRSKILCPVEIKVTDTPSEILKLSGQLSQYVFELVRTLKLTTDQITGIIVAPYISRYERVLFALANLAFKVEVYELTGFNVHKAELAIKKVELTKYIIK